MAQIWMNDSIYIILSTVPLETTYHWGLVITRTLPDSHSWHATSPFGGSISHSSPATAMTSKSLLAAYRIGRVNNANWSKVLQAVTSQPSVADGNFNCIMWVLNTVAAFDAAGIIKLSLFMDQIQANARSLAEEGRAAVESGAGSARIKNDTHASEGI